MMCLKIFLISLLCVSSAIAEGPYAPSGWRPQRPFNLPTDYLPPSRDIEEQQQASYLVEINKQRVDYAGQIQNNIPTLGNTYLPPRKTNTDFLKVQRPPFQKPGRQFVFKSVGPRPQDQQNTKIFQILNTQQKEPQQFGVRQESRISQPAQTYGPPSGGRKFHINYPDQQQEDDEVDEGARIAIEALNAARDAYNRQQQEEDAVNNFEEADVQEVDADGGKRRDGGYPASRATRGQYYVLGPDNRFQLVRFTTTQSEEEAQNDGGFSAKLRYTPVGEINDPVFKYDNRGQLVRIFKK